MVLFSSTFEIQAGYDSFLGAPAHGHKFSVTASSVEQALDKAWAQHPVASRIHYATHEAHASVSGTESRQAWLERTKARQVKAWQPPEPIETPGMDLRVWRTRRGLSQQGMATALGVAQQVYARWETGGGCPCATNAAAVYKLTGVSLPRRGE
jgi:DNA-binding transcriptional regulator YiaG